MRFACVVAYDGLCFHGWMAQKDKDSGKALLTVQGCLEHRLRGLLRREARVVAHGRTDAGVHSAGTVFHCDMTRAEAARLAGFMSRKRRRRREGGGGGEREGGAAGGGGGGGKGGRVGAGGGEGGEAAGGGHLDLAAAAQCLMNAFEEGTTVLPDQLRVLSCDAVCAARFHARRSSCGKAYVYRVAEGRPLPLASRGLHVLGKALDVAAMRAAAAALLGSGGGGSGGGGGGGGDGGDGGGGGGGGAAAAAAAAPAAPVAAAVAQWGVRDWSFLARKRELAGEWEPDRSPVRRLFALEVTREGGEGSSSSSSSSVVAIRIAGDFFLWNMCRRLAGLLVMVGLGQCSAEDVARDAAACLVQTLPPKGLELQEVWYAPDGCGLDPNSPAAAPAAEEGAPA